MDENQLACMLSSPLMFLGAILSVIHLYFHTSKANANLLMNTVVFLLIGISFELLRRVTYFKQIISL